MNPSGLNDLTRREWVKRFALGSATALGAERWCAPLLAEVGDPKPGPAVVRLKIADYPVLAATGGSLQLVFNEIAAPFTLNRVSDTRFVALDTICTHAQCTVGKFRLDPEGGGLPRMQCPCHGSRYDIEGRVFRNGKGESTEPAPNDLKQFATSFDPAAGIVEITIPTLVLDIYSLEIASRGANGQLRLRLRFPVTAGASYQIRRHATPQGPFTVATFATTATGVTNKSTYLALTAATTTLWVDSTGPEGFYTVAVVLSNFG